MWVARYCQTACVTVVMLGSSGAGSAHANDLAEALTFARGVMGDEIVEGYEDFVDYDPTEALPLLLARDLRPTTTPAEQVGSPPHFDRLGSQRLSYPQIRPHVERASELTGLPVALIDAVIRTESGYRPRAVSRAGARGLMQLMPATAAEMGVQDAFDPRDNVLGGARYLAKMYRRFGSLRLAVAAYNAGPAAVRRHGGVPPYRETRRYVKAVLRRYEQSTLR